MRDIFWVVYYRKYSTRVMSQPGAPETVVTESPMEAPKAEQSDDVQAAITQAKFASFQKRLNEGAWTDNMEQLLVGWGERAAALRWMHARESGQWKKFAHKLSLPVVAISTVSGMGSFGSTASNGPAAAVALYIIGFLNVCAAMIAATQRMYNPDEKSAQHGDTAKQFGAFYRELTLELTQPRSERSAPDVLAKQAKKEYDRLMAEAPNISPKTVAEFKRRFPHQENLPDVATDRFEIVVG